MNIIVVGAGIAGLSTAWSLVKAGHNVTLLEQGATIPNPLAASGDHHRIIRRAYRASTGYGALITERDVAVGDVTFHLLESGPDGAPVVLWLHGSGPGANARTNWEWQLGEHTLGDLLTAAEGGQQRDVGGGVVGGCAFSGAGHDSGRQRDE